MSDKISEIIDGLNKKACLKQYVFKQLLNVFEELKQVAQEISHEIAPEMLKTDPSVQIEYKEVSELEFHMKFSGDTIVCMMHTNIFAFPPDHEVSKNQLIIDDKTNGYFGMIQMYNFLSDSIRYGRRNDAGYLLGRIFINRHRNLYVDGKRQLGFLFKNIAKNTVSHENLKKVLEQAMLYCLDFDLYVPPMENFQQISLEQKDAFNHSTALPTGKRLGFVIESKLKD